jgi:hypothetical protein
MASTRWTTCSGSPRGARRTRHGSAAQAAQPAFGPLGVQLSGRVGAFGGPLLRGVAGAFGSSRALMSIVKVTASRTTALVAPAHAQGHDGDNSQDNEGNHDHDNSCVDGHRNHQGLALLLPVPRGTSGTRYLRANPRRA